MKGTMKAARLHGPDTIKIDEIPIPEIGPNDALVRAEAVYINGGDVIVYHTWRGPGRIPITMLHEIAGVVEEVGESVIDWKKGDRVVIDPRIACERSDCIYCGTDEAPYCPYSGVMGMFSLDSVTGYGQKIWEPYADGGFAEYVKAPARNLIALPDDVPFEIGARMTNVAVSYRAALNAQIMPGDTVILNAATGSSGSCTIPCILLFNPGTVIAIGRSEKKLQAIKDLAPGTIEVMSSEKENVYDRIREITKGRGADSLVDYSPPTSGRTFEQCILGLRNHGRAVLAGGNPEKLGLSYNYIMNTGISIVGSVAYPMNDVATVIRLTREGKLDWSGLITHRFPLSKAAELFETLARRIGDPIWVLGLPQEE
jgi:threonine dehydrogenase-like Zn-dependent dehydrogenase